MRRAPLRPSGGRPSKREPDPGRTTPGRVEVLRPPRGCRRARAKRRLRRRPAPGTRLTVRRRARPPASSGRSPNSSADRAPGESGDPTGREARLRRLAQPLAQPQAASGGELPTVRVDDLDVHQAWVVGRRWSSNAIGGRCLAERLGASPARLRQRPTPAGTPRGKRSRPAASGPAGCGTTWATPSGTSPPSPPCPARAR